MQNLVKVVVLSAALLLLATNIASAEDYISDAVRVLQETSIYVFPGTEGTDNDTSGKLGATLNSGDNIVLVMFPEDAKSLGDTYTIATSISEKLDNQRIIGLAVGKDVIGYAPMLPNGVASDLMRRADSVSNDPVTALITYVQNLHTWLAAHPQPTSTPRPTPTPTPTPALNPERQRTFTLIGLFGFTVIMMFALYRTFIWYRSSRRMRALEPIRSLISDTQDNIANIRDRRLRDDLNNACLAALGLLEMLLETKKPQGFLEEKFPELVKNMGMQVRAWSGHESGKRPIQQNTLTALKEVLLSYDELFVKLQDGNPESTDLLASIIDSNNTMITTLGFLPADDDQR